MYTDAGNVGIDGFCSVGYMQRAVVKQIASIVMMKMMQRTKGIK